MQQEKCVTTTCTRPCALLSSEMLGTFLRSNVLYCILHTHSSAPHCHILHIRYSSKVLASHCRRLDALIATTAADRFYHSRRQHDTWNTSFVDSVSHSYNICHEHETLRLPERTLRIRFRSSRLSEPKTRSMDAGPLRRLLHANDKHDS